MKKTPLISLLIVCAVSGALYSFFLPYMQGPDEHDHYKMSQFLVEHRRLHPYYPEKPSRGIPSSEEIRSLDRFTQAVVLPHGLQTINFTDTKWGIDEEATLSRRYERKVDLTLSNGLFHYSPLYYALIGVPYAAFYERDGLFRLHAMRLFSVFVYLIAVAFIYFLAREVFAGDGFAVLAASGVAAFIPQFMHISATLNNDIAVTLFATILFYLLCKTLTCERTDWKYLILGGIALAGAALGKPNGLILVGIIPLYYLLKLLIYGKAFWRRYLAEGAALFGTAFVFGGWHFIRVYSLTGNFLGPSGTGVMGDSPPLAFWQKCLPLFIRWQSKWHTIRILESFIAKFGWWDVSLKYDYFEIFTTLFYLSLLLTGVIGVQKFIAAGYSFRVLATRHRQSLFLVLSIIAVDYAYGFLMPWLSQGRYYFFILPALILVGVKSLTYYLPLRYRSSVYAVMLVGMLLFNFKMLYHELLMHYYVTW